LPNSGSGCALTASRDAYTRYSTSTARRAYMPWEILMAGRDTPRQPLTPAYRTSLRVAEGKWFVSTIRRFAVRSVSCPSTRAPCRHRRARTLLHTTIWRTKTNFSRRIRARLPGQENDVMARGTNGHFSNTIAMCCCRQHSFFEHARRAKRKPLRPPPSTCYGLSCSTHTISSWHRRGTTRYADAWATGDSRRRLLIAGIVHTGGSAPW